MLAEPQRGQVAIFQKYQNNSDRTRALALARNRLEIRTIEYEQEQEQEYEKGVIDSVWSIRKYDMMLRDLAS